ncbi:hypothetical protein [Streptomyces phaeochromogenes]|uniref:hypothetical protein n=1 Tax=Streptomyces phaeochromogenes TaxID=1923 RepID=UPI002DD7AA1C|nr:hypothetical protein [Streptomyces phaeochromogenes]
MALERSAKYAWSCRERLGLHRSPQELAPGAVEISGDEIEGAQALIDHMTRDSLEGGEFVDHYTDALAEVIQAAL